jgi:hypothetical protein
MSAVMAKYNPFAEKAGMRKVAVQEPSKEALKIVGVLKDLGFNIEMLSSLNYVQGKVDSLSSLEVRRIRDVFLKSKHPRFLKNFSYDLPYGRTEDYKKKIEGANLERLSQLIRVCGFLLQSKVYLFWRRA